jgi:16S rRNA (guanine527-N7)-methyltransferase
VRPAAPSSLDEGARSILGRPLSATEAEAFDKYLHLLQKWQRVQRLVGSTDPDWMVENLLLDSLLFLRVLPAEAASLADLGSGAGLPGIPLGIVRPDLSITLIESRQRRVSFLSTVVRELGLAGTSVLNARAEEVAAQRPASFDAVLVRCAGEIAAVVPTALRLVVPGGVVILSGPPAGRPLEDGEWVEVPGVRPGQTRRFAVFRRQTGPEV